MEQKNSSVLNLAVIVASLGYFVDIYDLLLFAIIRIKSLTSLGLSGSALQSVGLSLLNYQMIGLLFGGVIWGILGDKRGRLSVLFGSILLYSLGNIGNGFITGAHAIEWYKAFRLLSGLGLAGELGAGVTLVAEILPKEKRGYGTAILAAVGISGAVVAYFISKTISSWRVCYFVGGGLGLILLVLRISVAESGMFHSTQNQQVSRGNYLAFFTNRERFFRYLKCILLGLPTWYLVGILIAFSDGFAKSLHVQGKIDPGKAVMLSYALLTIGNLVCSYLSELMKSRKKILFIFYAIVLISIIIYFSAYRVQASTFYWICCLIGFSAGFWAVFVTVAAEQFGTNLRATAAITVPNFVRGALPLIVFLFHFLGNDIFKSDLKGALWTGIVCVVIAFIAAIFLQETYGKDLDYVEMINTV
jgi:MFS transporter, putative metabolite:H+ symporter